MTRKLLIVLALALLLGAVLPSPAPSQVTCLFNSDCYVLAPCAACLVGTCVLTGCHVIKGGDGAVCYSDLQCEPQLRCIAGYCTDPWTYSVQPGADGPRAQLFTSPADLIARLVPSGGCTTS